MLKNFKDKLQSLSKSQFFLGVDIGTSNIAIAELEYKKNKPKLTAFNFEKIPGNCWEDGQFVNISGLSEAIKKIYQSGGFHKKKAVIAVAGSYVIIKRITVPQVEGQMMETQIRFEAENYIPFNMNNIFFDYFKLKTSEQKDSVDVVIVAILDSNLVEFLEIVEVGGLACETMEAPNIAMANNYFFNYSDIQDKTVAIINIGHSYTNFIVCSQGELVFSRDLALGGRLYTSEIQKQDGSSFDEAEEKKLEILNPSSPPESFKEYKEVFDVAHATLATEVEITIEQFNDLYGRAYPPLEKCLFVGGSSQVPGLLENLQKTLNLECELFDTFRKLEWSGKLLTNQYIDKIKAISPIAIGLCFKK